MRRLSSDEVSQYTTDGFVVVRGALGVDIVQRIRREILSLVPASLDIPSHWKCVAGRIKPYREGGRQSFDAPAFIDVFQNVPGYEIAAQLLNSKALRVRDGSISITLRNDAKPLDIRSQTLHLDLGVPEDLDQFSFSEREVELGGCLYLTDVRENGGGIHVVPGAHRMVESIARHHPKGRQLFDKWRELPSLDSMEVTGNAGDLVLMHHMMPHAASHNTAGPTRVAQFIRYSRADSPYPVSTVPGSYPGEDGFKREQLVAMSQLGRCLMGVSPWPHNVDLEEF